MPFYVLLYARISSSLFLERFLSHCLSLSFTVLLQNVFCRLTRLQRDFYESFLGSKRYVYALLLGSAMCSSPASQFSSLSPAVPEGCCCWNGFCVQPPSLRCMHISMGSPLTMSLLCLCQQRGRRMSLLLAF